MNMTKTRSIASANFTSVNKVTRICIQVLVSLFDGNIMIAVSTYVPPKVTFGSGPF